MGDGVTVAVPADLCRRCVRLLSRHVRDVPGVVSLQVRPAQGRLLVTGDVDAAAVRAARDRAGFRPDETAHRPPPDSVADRCETGAGFLPRHG
jgi:hypothetical protein